MALGIAYFHLGGQLDAFLETGSRVLSFVGDLSLGLLDVSAALIRVLGPSILRFAVWLIPLFGEGIWQLGIKIGQLSWQLGVLAVTAAGRALAAIAAMLGTSMGLAGLAVVGVAALLAGAGYLIYRYYHQHSEASKKASDEVKSHWQGVGDLMGIGSAEASELPPRSGVPRGQQAAAPAQQGEPGGFLGHLMGMIPGLAWPTMPAGMSMPGMPDIRGMAGAAGGMVTDAAAKGTALLRQARDALPNIGSTESLDINGWARKLAGAIPADAVDPVKKVGDALRAAVPDFGSAKVSSRTAFPAAGRPGADLGRRGGRPGPASGLGCRRSTWIPGAAGSSSSSPTWTCTGRTSRSGSEPNCRTRA